MGLYFNIALFLPLNEIEGKEIILKGYVIDRKIEFKKNDNESIKNKGNINGEYILRVKYLNKKKLIKTIKVKVYTDEVLLLGDEIVLNGNYTQGEIQRNYKGFNYRNYLRQNGIYGIVNVEDNCLKCIGENDNIEIFFMRIKERVNISLEKYFEDGCLGFMQSLLFGNKNNLTDEIKDLFKDTSISHVLAISGLHVGIVLISFENVLKVVSKNKRLNNYLEIVFLVFFYILTGMQISCFRSVVFNIFTIIGMLKYEKTNIRKTVLFTYFILILVNVYNVINIGMYLSFLSSVSIIVFNKVYTHLYEYKLERIFNVNIKKYNLKLGNNKIIKCVYGFLKSNFIVSISAQVLILPIMIYNFNFFSLNFIISNLFIAIFVSMFLKVGYIIVLIDFINIFKFKFVFFINRILVGSISKVLELVFSVLNVIRKLKFLNIVFNTPSVIIVIIYYIFILICIYKFNNNVNKNYKYLLTWNRKEIKKILKKNSKVLICILVIIIFNNIVHIFPNKRFEFVFYRCGTGRLYISKIRYK